MNTKHMIFKKKYKVTYKEKPFILSIKDMELFKDEILLLIKEITLYNISFKSLACENPKTIIKNELLNIAVICNESESISNKIKISRQIPIKDLAVLIQRNQRYIQRWRNHILLYFIIISNDYKNIFSFLNIEKEEPFENSSDESSIKPNIESNPGIVLKTKGKYSYILTAYGDILHLQTEEEKSLGEICIGKIKKEKKLYKFPIRLAVICIIIALFASYFIFYNTERTVLINSSFSIKLELNKWNRVIKLTGVNSKGKEIINSTDLSNKSVDEALSSILSKGIEKSYINRNSTITVYISGNTASNLNLPKTNQLVTDNKMDININNNGLDISPK